MSAGSPFTQSIQARLVRIAHEMAVDPNLILTRYACERFLYRLSRSKHADRFVLKGAMLMVAWLGDMLRPTRDVDLLGFGDLGVEALATMFAEIARTDVQADGVFFDADSIRVARIRDEDVYGGHRVVLHGALGPARLRVQIDVGLGDAVYPDPQPIEYPSLLDLPAPRIRGYSRETAVAEKLHAMVVLGSKNSRMRDFFDVRTLAGHGPFDGAILLSAIKATFERRGTPIPGSILALSPRFAHVEGKSDQWRAFLRKNALAEEDLASVIDSIAAFLGPLLAAGAGDHAFEKVWIPGGPWS